MRRCRPLAIRMILCKILQPLRIYEVRCCGYKIAAIPNFASSANHGSTCPCSRHLMVISCFNYLTLRYLTTLRVKHMANFSRWSNSRRLRLNVRLCRKGHAPSLDTSYLTGPSKLTPAPAANFKPQAFRAPSSHGIHPAVKIRDRSIHTLDLDRHA